MTSTDAEVLVAPIDADRLALTEIDAEFWLLMLKLRLWFALTGMLKQLDLRYWKLKLSD